MLPPALECNAPTPTPPARLCAEAVRLLLAAGAPPNAPDAYGATAVHYATCTWLHHLEGSPRLPRRAASHADIPALLLQAGGDIFSPTASSNGTPVHSPLAALADYTPSDAALHAFLQYAGDQHEAGAWVPPAGLNMDRLVRQAVRLKCKAFSFPFGSICTSTMSTRCPC